MNETTVLVGLIIAIIGYYWCVIIAFRESFLWGLGSLLLPLVWMFHVLTRLDRTWLALLITVLGLILFFGAGGASLLDSEP